MSERSYRADFARARTFSEFLADAKANEQLWQTTYRLAQVDPQVVERLGSIGGAWKLLVLLEDWCGDAVNTVPYLQRLAELAPNLELRVLSRDQNLEIMDAHLSGSARAIPVVMVLDENGIERGWWGSRPSQLQQWFVTEGKLLEKDRRYRDIRAWYARDRGRSTVNEVLVLIEHAAAARDVAA